MNRQLRKVCRAPYLVVGCRGARSSQAEKSLESSHGLLSAIVPKDELVKVDLELGAAYPVVSADEPLLQVTDGAIRERHRGFRALAQLGSQRLSARHVLVPTFWKAGEALEAIGIDGRARSNVLPNEAVHRSHLEVGDDCHADAPRGSSALLDRDQDECRSAPLLS